MFLCKNKLIHRFKKENPLFTCWDNDISSDQIYTPCLGDITLKSLSIYSYQYIHLN